MRRLLGIVSTIFSDIALMFVINMPGVTGIRLRRLYYKYRFRSCGENLIVETGVHIVGEEYISVGDNVFFDKNTIIATGNNVQGNVHRKPNSTYNGEAGYLYVGSDIHICQGCIIMAYGGIEIHDKSVLSANSKLYSLTNLAYDPDDRSRRVYMQPYNQAEFLLSPIVLMENVWLGLNTTVMPGVVIGKDSFVVSNSTVMSDFGSNSYIAGQPAVFLRQRFQ